MSVLRRMAVAAVSGALAAGALVVVAAPASAGFRSVHGVAGRVESAVQGRDGSLTVTGWALRTSQPNRHMRICIWSGQHCRVQVYTRIWRPALNERHHIRGNHGFRVVLPRRAVGYWAVLRDYRPGSPIVSQRAVSTPGARIIAVARRYVGRAPYRSGGASPAGFDCSGFTLYSYARAGVASLPHSSNAQRYAPHKRRIYAWKARPGDLVFYLSGGHGYHVSVYAGHGMQYSATVAGERIRYQHVWSSSVEYRTDWH